MFERRAADFEHVFGESYIIIVMSSLDARCELQCEICYEPGRQRSTRRNRNGISDSSLPIAAWVVRATTGDISILLLTELEADWAEFERAATECRWFERAGEREGLLSRDLVDQK